MKSHPSDQQQLCHLPWMRQVLATGSLSEPRPTTLTPVTLQPLSIRLLKNNHWSGFFLKRSLPAENIFLVLWLMDDEWVFLKVAGQRGLHSFTFDMHLLDVWSTAWGSVTTETKKTEIYVPWDLSTCQLTGVSVLSHTLHLRGMRNAFWNLELINLYEDMNSPASKTLTMGTGLPHLHNYSCQSQTDDSTKWIPKSSIAKPVMG